MEPDEAQPKVKADPPPKTSHRSKRHHYGEEGVRVKERNIYMFMFRDGEVAFLRVQRHVHAELLISGHRHAAHFP